jgi:methylated-DNA-[protein]-cysteine S-methyltransferase
MQTLYYSEMMTPAGPITLVSDGSSITTISLHQLAAATRDGRAFERRESDDVLQLAHAQLRDYFAGRLRTFSLPLAAEGTPFQHMVWAALREIPFGQTTSYGALAARVGRPGAARAVGAANRLNPIAIVVPCHRVIGANGKLTGYAGGLQRKSMLLEHEARVSGAVLPL